MNQGYNSIIVHLCLPSYSIFYFHLLMMLFFAWLPLQGYSQNGMKNLFSIADFQNGHWHPEMGSAKNLGKECNSLP